MSAVSRRPISVHEEGVAALLQARARHAVSKTEAAMGRRGPRASHGHAKRPARGSTPSSAKMRVELGASLHNDSSGERNARCRHRLAELPGAGAPESLTPFTQYSVVNSRWYSAHAIGRATFRTHTSNSRSTWSRSSGSENPEPTRGARCGPEYIAVFKEVPKDQVDKCATELHQVGPCPDDDVNLL
jgi:hypothetical protein